MQPLDLERFWADNERASKDPFCANNPQPRIGIYMGYECAFGELGEPYDPLRLERDAGYARELARAYNRRAVQIVGRPLLSEDTYDPEFQPPALRDIAEVFGCERQWHAGSWWHMQAASTPTELERLLDRVDGLDLRREIFPVDWHERERRYRARFGRPPHRTRDVRGPVTLATSIYGAENLIYLILDEPGLAGRLRDTILRVIIDYFSIVEQVCGVESFGPGFSFRDDNCALLTPEMYAFFGQPILKRVFERFAPGLGDRRYQHSDSDMAHLLPLLAETGLNAVNFGPTLSVRQIREAMPGAVIYGQLAPFTFMSNDEEAIMAEVRRDCRQSLPERGLIVATAGSVNNGTKLTSLRAVMHAIQAGSPDYR
ncbi:MAG: hypothetical protein IT442_15385 [Phycisphaeraceae bacterium]|nr:hypothetical protein [Phycisphaeraceae bacterium]